MSGLVAWFECALHKGHSIARICIISLVLSTITISAFATSPASEDLELELGRLDGQQRQMLREIKAKLATIPESDNRDQLAALLAEIERRISEAGPLTSYIDGDKNVSPQMSQYIRKTRRRIEDCGTRNFPVQDGEKLYGEGALAIRLDQDGRLLAVELVESSGNSALDEHLQRLVTASAPFGRWPAKVRKNSNLQFGNIVLYSTFNFRHDGKLPPPLPADSACKWQLTK